MSHLPTTMQGVQLEGHGGPEMLLVRQDIPVPQPGASDVLIKVAAAAVNNTDINTRTAWYSKQGDDSADATWSGKSLAFPRIQGADVCGVIVAVGADVDSARVGERVLIEPCLTRAGGQQLAAPWYFGSECDGGFAEYTVVDSQHAYRVNSTLSDAQLASFPCSYSTAENMLERAAVNANDTVLIAGASGGVGSAAIQLAKARGASVFAITSASKQQQVLDLGVDKVIDRASDLVEQLGKNSVTVVIDLVAGPQWPQFLELLQPGGRYAVAGAIGGALVELDIRSLYLKDLSFFGCTVLAPQVFQNLVHRIEADEVKPLVAQCFPLAQIAQAQASFEQKQHVGKLVLTL